MDSTSLGDQSVFFAVYVEHVEAPRQDSPIATMRQYKTVRQRQAIHADVEDIDVAAVAGGP